VELEKDGEDQLTSLVKNDEVISTVKKEKDIRHKIKRRKANSAGHMLGGNCLLKHITEGKVEGRIEVMGRRRKRRKQPLDGLKEKRKYGKLKEEAPDHTLWKAGFERACGQFKREIRRRMYVKISFMSTDFDSYVQN
jgi:hypothetical protein